tara:strand:- start:1499 stop:2938 length:1440 start_codon:yes stop_codon:yes gene_type:complete
LTREFIMHKDRISSIFISKIFLLRPSKGIFFITIFFLLSITSIQADTLKNALEKIYLTNPSIQSARLNLRNVDESVSQALSGWRPVISIDASAGFSDTETDSKLSSTSPTLTSTSTLEPRSYSIAITEPIYRGGKTLAETRSAELNVQAQRASLKVTEKEQFLDGINAYIQVLRWQYELGLSRTNEKNISQHYEAAKDKYEVGLINATEVLQSKARAYAAKAERVASEGALISAEADYFYIIGDNPANLSWPIPASKLPNNEHDAINIALKNNHSILEANYRVLAAREDINVALADLLPQVSLEAKYNSQYDVTSLIEKKDQTSLTAIVNIPLYQKGMIHSQIRQSKLRAAEKELHLELKRKNVINQTSRAWEELLTSESKLLALKQQVKAAKAGLEGVKQESFVGLKTTLDVLDAEKDLYTSRVNLVRARADVIVSSYQLKSVLGMLTASSLNFSTPLYDDNFYYLRAKKKLFGTEIK